MKALALQQGYTVLCNTSRDASRNDDTRTSANRGCSAPGTLSHLEYWFEKHVAALLCTISICRIFFLVKVLRTVEAYSTLGLTKVL